MAKLISPQGTATTVADTQVQALVRLGWKRPQDITAEAAEPEVPAEAEEAEPETEKKPAAKRRRASTSK